MPTEVQGFQLEAGSITLDKLNQSGANNGDAPIWNGSAWAPSPPGGGSTANALATTGAPVNVSSAAPPTVGKVLTSTDATHATWQTPASSGVTLDGAYDFGGSGAGRVITADSGAVHIDKPGVNADNAFEVSVTAGSGAGQTITMGATTSGHGLSVTMTAGATGLAGRFFGATISVPGGGANSERFGAGAVAGGLDSTVLGSGSTDGNFQGVTIVGRASSALNDFGTVFGNASTSGFNSVVIGPSSAAGDNSVSIGANIVNPGNNNTAVGQGVSAGLVTDTFVVVVGSSIVGGGTSTVSMGVGGNVGTTVGNTDCVGVGIGVNAFGNRVNGFGYQMAIDQVSTVQPSFDVTVVGGQGGVAGRQVVLAGSSGLEGLQGDNLCGLGYLVGQEDIIFMSQTLLGVGAMPIDQPLTFIAGSPRQPATDVWFGAGERARGAVSTTLHGTKANSATAFTTTPATPTATPISTPGSSTWAAGTYNYFAVFYDGVGESNRSTTGSFTLAAGEYPLFDLFDANADACGQFIYIEDAPGSGVYRQAQPFTGTGLRRLISGLGPERYQTQPTTEPIRTLAAVGYTRTGTGGALNFAGGYGRLAANTGGNIGFYTGRTGASDVSTLAGYFNAADGTLSVPGAGSGSERFGLNTVADRLHDLSVGLNATTWTRDSVAIGPNNVSGTSGASTGGYNITLGNDNQAGVGSTGNPTDNIAIGDSSLAGVGSHAANGENIAIGETCIAGASTASVTFQAQSNIAIGDQCIAGGDAGTVRFNVAIGEVCVAGSYTGGGRDNVSIGDGAEALGDYNIAIGTACSTTDGGNHGIVLGHSATATGNEAIAIGHGASAGANEVALGIDTSASVKFKIGTTNGMQFGSGSTVKIGWWGATPVVRSAVATLTNSVTAGGTTDTVANFTDLVIYANDASTIRDDIYQLARKVRELTEALRLYGILG